jgi:hypothetical protein
MQTQQEEVTKGALIAGIGAYGVYWCFNQPCNIAANPALGLSTEMARLMCLSVDWKITIVLLIASTAIFTGAGRFFKNI